MKRGLARMPRPVGHSTRSGEVFFLRESIGLSPGLRRSVRPASVFLMKQFAHPLVCLNRCLIQPRGCFWKAGSNPLEQAMSPRILRGKYHQAHNQKQHSLQYREKQSNHAQQDESPPNEQQDDLFCFCSHCHRQQRRAFFAQIQVLFRTLRRWGITRLQLQLRARALPPRQAGRTTQNTPIA